MKDVLTHEDMAVGSYHFAVSRLIPQMTEVALQSHKRELMRETPNFAKQKFLFRLSRSDYEKQWGKDYVKPRFGTSVLSTLLKYMPKVGPFKKLAFNHPTPQTEDLYVKSINTTVDQYRSFLKAVGTDSIILPNCDLDSGKKQKRRNIHWPTIPTQSCWLLSERKFDRATPELRENILQFYSDLSLPIETKKDQGRWEGVLTSLDQLRTMSPGPTVAVSPAQ